MILSQLLDSLIKNKTNVGRVAGNILQTININLRIIQNLQQLQAANEVVEWINESYNPNKRHTISEIVITIKSQTPNFDIKPTFRFIDKKTKQM